MQGWGLVHMCNTNYISVCISDLLFKLYMGFLISKALERTSVLPVDVGLLRRDVLGTSYERRRGLS